MGCHHRSVLKKRLKATSKEVCVPSHAYIKDDELESKLLAMGVWASEFITGNYSAGRFYKTAPLGEGTLRIIRQETCTFSTVIITSLLACWHYIVNIL